MGKNIGSLEEITLLAVQSLAKDAYGVSIHRVVTNEGYRNINIGSLYITLGRLEEKNYLTSKLGESSLERGGRAKKFYSLTGHGQLAIAEAEESRESIRQLGAGRLKPWTA